MTTRSARLADRLEAHAKALCDYAETLTPAQWQTPMPHDGRPIGVIVHDVASVYPVEIQLAQGVAAGTKYLHGNLVLGDAGKQDGVYCLNELDAEIAVRTRKSRGEHFLTRIVSENNLGTDDAFVLRAMHAASK